LPGSGAAAEVEKRSNSSERWGGGWISKVETGEGEKGEEKIYFITTHLQIGVIDGESMEELPSGEYNDDENGDPG
jgi:hypothetical protein